MELKSLDHLLTQWFFKFSPRSVASASPGSSLEQQILGPTPDPTDERTPGGQLIVCF